MSDRAELVAQLTAAGESARVIAQRLGICERTVVRYRTSPRKWMTRAEVDRRIEDKVRTVPCPVCHATPGRRCDYGDDSAQVFAHTGRYRAAAKAWLVPAFAGEA